MLEEGMQAPDFTLGADDGSEVTLSSFRGSTVVLYFYPKDNTSGCTKEACSFRDTIDDLRALDAIVIGISPDGEASHRKFREKHALPFMLLSDPDHGVMERYDAYGEKMMYGKRTTGVIRKTFIISPDGTIGKIFRKVNTATHGEDVRKYLEDRTEQELESGYHTTWEVCIRRIMAVMCTVLILLSLVSCKSEEEKAMDRAREMYSYILEESKEALFDAYGSTMSKEEKADIEDEVKTGKQLLKEADTEEEIEDAGMNYAGGMFFLTALSLDMESLDELTGKIVDKYPEAETFVSF